MMLTEGRCNDTVGNLDFKIHGIVEDQEWATTAKRCCEYICVGKPLH